jgi:hypothetical protein
MLRTRSVRCRCVGVGGRLLEGELVLVERDGNAMALVTRGEGVASESCD